MTIEELQEQLANANANVVLLSNELSNQAEQFAQWRDAVSAIAGLAFDSVIDADERVSLIKYQVEAICGV